MAGTLVISTLSDGTNSTSSTNCISGSAKAWVNFNGSTAAIRASYNVSSVTRSAVGRYTINFTNAFADTNYAYTFGGWNNGSGNGGWNSAGIGSGSYPAGISTSSLSIATFQSSGVDQDQDAVCVSIFR